MSDSRKPAREERVFRPPVVRGPWAGVVLAGVLLLCLLPLGMFVYYGYVQHHLAYRVSEAGLVVDTGWGRIVVPAAEVAGVGRLPEPDRVVRSFGAAVRGLQMGWYRMDGERVYRLTTSGRELVYVDVAADAATARAGTRYVLSPADPDRFVALVRAAQAGQWDADDAGTDEVVFEPPPGPSLFADPLLWLSLLVTLPPGIVLPWLVTSGAKGMHFRVGPEGIAVHHLGRRLYRWESIKSVQRLDQVPRLWRTMGASLPGYHAGNFTARELGPVKLYAAVLAPPMVLLETTTGRVLLGPEDVDGFIRAVETYRKGRR